MLSMEDAHKRDYDLDRDLVDAMSRLNGLMNRTGVSTKTQIALHLAYTELAAERNVISRRWD